MRLIFILLTLVCAGCGPLGNSNENESTAFLFSEELAYCADSEPVADHVTVTSQAQFEARQVTVNGLGGPGAPVDIKYAEVEVVDSRGQRIQCGSTSQTGQVLIHIPNVPGKYTLKVNSRADNSYYKASVLNNPSANSFYSIRADFTVDSRTTLVTVELPIAPVNSSLEGGAFNILDQIYLANKFIRENSNCTICESFTVAPKVRIYWTPGLSPYSYYGDPTTGLSFFTATDSPSVGIRSGLYIQGGVEGDVNCSDTDHFDNSIILHEYAHFLESAFAGSDSPGGSHNGNGIIDPRLAWSEGWANFFQTAVTGSNYYRDTIGNSTCGAGTFLAINLNLETPTAGQDKMAPGTRMGEGVFREISVARTLFDTMESSGADGGAGVGFSFVWKVFSDSENGFRNPSVHFRNIGLFNQYMQNLISSQASASSLLYNSVLDSEYQLSDESQYALNTQAKPGSSCSFSIQGVADHYSMGSYISNLFQSNDFYEFLYDGSSPQIQLHYSGSSPSDLDLYLYTKDYVFDDPTTMARISRNSYPELAGGGLETIDLSGLPTGSYIINIRVNTESLGQTANYYLTNSSGTRICP